MSGAGECFLLETNFDAAGYVKSHLHVVALDYEEHTGTTVIVVVETFEGKKDSTTLLKPGDHEFIKRVSYVNYRRATTTALTDLKRLIAAGVAKPMAPFSGEALTRVQKGIIDSPFTPKYVADYCRRRLEDAAFEGLG